MDSRRVALISGAGRGIGAAIAKQFASENYDLMLVSRTESELQAVKQSIIRSHQVNVELMACDLKQQQNCEAIVVDTKLKLGGIDVLVNCAGIIKREPTVEHSISDWDTVMSTNVRSAFLLSKLAIQEMLQQTGGGSIINISSQMAVMPHLGASPSYESSKAAMEALTRHLAAEYAEKNIRVNTVSPGSIETSLSKNMNKHQWNKICSQIPMGRLGKTTEVANAVSFLASERASYITGNNIYVAGGSVMH